MNKGNMLFLKSWPRNSNKSKLRRWEGGGSEEVGASCQASLGFTQLTLFQTCLRLRSCFNMQQKAPQNICTFPPHPKQKLTHCKWGRKKKREVSRFAVGFYKALGTKPLLSN